MRNFDNLQKVLNDIEFLQKSNHLLEQLVAMSDMFSLRDCLYKSYCDKKFVDRFISNLETHFGIDNNE